MNEELINKAMKLFDSADKWNSFFELINVNGDIQRRWWQKLQSEVFQREIKIMNHDWDIFAWENSHIRWYIKGSKVDSLAIHFFENAFRLFHGFGALDNEKVNLLIKDPKFDILRICFDRFDGSDHQSIGLEYRNFHFNTIFDGRFPDNRALSWYAGNKTHEFADQLIAKVRKFQTPEVTELFKEINNTCKRS